MSEPRSNIAFASKLVAEGLSADEIVARLAERGLDEFEARSILEKLVLAEARPSIFLSYVLVGLGLLMLLFGGWVIVSSYNDPEILNASAGRLGGTEYEFTNGSPLLRRMWRVTLMCWVCGGLILSTGVYKIARAKKTPKAPTPIAKAPAAAGGPKQSVADLRRFALKERVKGLSREAIIEALVAKGCGPDLAASIADSAR